MKNFWNLLGCAYFAFVTMIEYNAYTIMAQTKIADVTITTILWLVLFMALTVGSVALTLAFGKAYFKG